MHNSIRVLALPRYGRKGASSRIRMYQFVTELERHGIEVVARPFFGDDYQENLYIARRLKPWSLVKLYAERVRAVCMAKKFDLIWLEYEIFPWLPAFFERWLNYRGVPCLVDYDDAIFHRYDQNKHFWIRYLLGQKIDKIMRRAKIVTVGNNYLAERAGVAGAARVEVLPSVVALSRYSPRTSAGEAGVFTIGWIGSPSTARYLGLIKAALTEVCRLRRVRLVLVGVGSLELGDLPAEIIPWSEATEVALLHTFDVGLMPLADEPWERGKCGFKLIQYMACGLPVVATPVGVNCDLVVPGGNGYLAESHNDWVMALLTLIDNPDQRHSFGQAGRRLVEEDYCLEKMVPKLVTLLRQAAGRDVACAD